MIPNATKAVRAAKTAHTAIVWIYEYIEDAANFVYLSIDLVLFGQPISIGLNPFDSD